MAVDPMIRGRTDRHLEQVFQAIRARLLTGARRLAAALAVVVMTAPSVSAQLDTDHTGTLSRISVNKSGLAFGATATLTFDLDYIFRVSALMGEPVVNCGLRVYNLRGRVALTLMGQHRQIQVGQDNSAEVAVLHLGFLMHRPGLVLGVVSGFVGSLTIMCPHGVLARDNGQPFNTPSSPGIERFLCANANVPDPGRTNTLPDMLGRDWCTDLGGTFLSAEQVRGHLRDGVMDRVFGQSWFQPRVAALGIGIGELVGNERQRLSELEREQEQTGDEDQAAPDPASTIARMAAERARALGGDGDSPEERLARIRRGDRQPQASEPASDQDHTGSALVRMRNQRAAEEARARLAAIAAERSELTAAHAAAREACEVGRPVYQARPAPAPNLVLLSTSGPRCFAQDRECILQRERQAEIYRQRERERRERERRERERREREEHARAEAARLAEHQRAFAEFERELPRCLARTDDAFQTAMRQLDADEHAARLVVARLD